MQEDESFAIWVGLLIICLYLADDGRVSISQSTELISLLHHFGHLALRSPATTKQIKTSLFI